jgi:hypothetical protein
LKKYNPYRNIFYYFRGAHNSDRLADKQIEDNTTKAFINTLEYSDVQLLHYFLENIKVPVNKSETPKYDLQVAELLSRPDAQIRVGKTDYYIESKVQAPLEEHQINNHLVSIGESILIVITLRESDRQILEKFKNPRLKFITWEEIYILFSRKNDINNFILSQFLKYLESTGMAPFNGFTKEDFDSFLYVEEDPKKEIRSIVKRKFKKYLDEIQDEIKSIPAYSGLVVDVGNLHKGSHSIWGTLSDESKSKVNVPHFNFALNRNTFSIGFIVEGKVPANRFYKYIKANPKTLLKLLIDLPGFQYEIEKREYQRIRVYKSTRVASIKCGPDIKFDDIVYIQKKAEQYALVLTWCRIVFERDDNTLSSKSFIKSSVKYLNHLRPLYEFSLGK